MNKVEYFRKESKFDIVKPNDKLKFPTDIFPDNVKYIIERLHESADFEPQVTGSTILFVISTVIGLSRKIVVKAGTWEDTPNLWLAIVGRRGTMKSPASSYILKPLTSDEKLFGKEFNDAMASYMQIPKKDRSDAEKPKRRQRFSNDTTVEGLIDAMEYNYNGMGVYKDELNGFFESMNQYKSGGGDMEFYLSAFNGGMYVKNRKSYDPQTIDEMYLSMLGSIQPEVLKNVAVKQTQNGMIDRWLYILSDDIVPHTTDSEVPAEITEEYNIFIASVVNSLKTHSVMQWLPGSKEAFFMAVNGFEDVMRSDECDPALFTYLSKIKTYLARFIVIITTMHNSTYIGIDHVNMAVKLANYFISTAMAMFIGFDNQKTIIEVFKSENANTKKEKVIAIKKHFPSLNNTEIGLQCECSRVYVSRILNNQEV